MHTRMTFFMKLAICAFVCFCILTIIQLQLKFNELRQQTADMEQQIMLCEDNIDELNEKLDQPYDEDYVERVARDQMNYCMPDEVVIYNDR